MTPEGKVVSDVKKRVKALGGEVRKCVWVGHVGAPDLFIMFPGCHFWLEVKAEKGKLSPPQEREIARMRNAGCAVYVAYGSEEAIKVIGYNYRLHTSKL